MTLKTYDYRDPGKVVAAVSKTHDIAPGDVLLVVIRDPSTTQSIEHVRKLDRREWGDLDEWELADYLAEQVRRLPIPPRGAQLRHSVLTIVARNGFAVFGRGELRWMYAWRYSNHMVDAFSGDVVLLTDHGWCDFTTMWGGSNPRLASTLVPAQRIDAS